MASYNTSFIVNAADLAKILEQIKIAEAEVAGGDLANIIGQDNALLPMGLRTVDGSNNHLLPGQKLAGAADQVFPRLLTPEYVNDQDGDVMPLGPPGGPAVTNTNYDPTIPAGTDGFGVNLHSVADADPRIISNLIVDQTLTNKSALVAALMLTNDNDILASTASADAILAARAAALAAQPFAAATAAAYASASSSSGTAQTQIGNAVASLTSLRGDGADDGVIGTPSAADDAVAAVNAALVAATDALAALQTPGTTVDAADVASAQALVNSLTALVADITAVQASIADGITVPEFNGIVNALTSAQAVSASAQAFGSAIADGSINTAKAEFVRLIDESGLSISSDGSILIENRSPDIGLSPANSGWMTFFGQFFDHGLDLVTKGNNGTVYIPLQADDPLIAGADHVFGTADDLAPELRFMALSRATPFDANGNPSPTGTESQNTTTPFVDQNQTYTSSPSHQVFLREYKFSVDSDNDTVKDSFALNTGRLLNGANGGIANWKEVKDQAAEKLGLILDDYDVFDVPKLAVDPYGKFTPGPNGYAQVIVALTQTNGTTTTVSEIRVEGRAGGLDINALTLGDITSSPDYNPALGVPGTFVLEHTGHAFLNDISHHAEPGFADLDHNGSKETKLVADSDMLDFNGDGFSDAADVVAAGALLTDANLDNVIDVLDLADVNLDGTIDAKDLVADDHNPATYDNEMLEAHFVTGDGRGNENIGLTAVHTIFHSEHNRLVEANKDTLIATGDVNVVNEWLAAGPGDVRNSLTQAQLNAINAIADPNAKAAAIDALDWDGERLFQAARFVTEMQYQHLVFEEFARRVQPNVDPFVFTNSADLDPAIVAEFAHTVYRFGHSMLTDTVDRLDNDLTNVNSNASGVDDATQVGLIEAFLNPQEFTASGVDDETATGAIIRGMSRQIGNEIDEFVVEALRNNLLGLPLDLAALNMARGRDQGIPSLNDSRAQLYAMTGAVDVKPYTSWVDFTQHIKHPLSVINFIAAYGTHATITSAATLDEKRAAATALVLGGPGAPADRLDFLNATGAYAADGAGPNDDSLGGLNNIDLWIGGLAEELNEFGGQLGSTFNFIFEYQLEHLQNGDRFYYLSRTQGMNLLNLLEPNTFTDLIMRNTDLGDLHATHLPAEIMEVPDLILELDTLVAQTDYNGTEPGIDPTWEDPFQQAIDPKVLRVQGVLRVGELDAEGQPIYDGGILKFSGGEHVVLGGTEGNDKLYGDKGIDTLWGDAGNDYLNAGMESDQVFGGDGDDIIEDPFGDDFLRGEGGDDVIVADQGLDLLFGGEGQDFIMGVTDTKEVFAGPGNDFVLGGSAPDGLMGNEGDDWIEGGEGFDSLSGENSELFFNSPIIGHDILNGQGNDTDYDGESGDDIMVQGAGIQRNNGMLGFDWSIQKGDENDGLIDLGISRFLTQQALTLRDRNDSVEAASGWKHNDTLIGTTSPTGAVGDPVGGIVGAPTTDSMLLSQNVRLINGFAEFLALTPGALRGQTVQPNNTNFASLPTDTTVFDPSNGGDILLGGAGSDLIIGKAGNDLIDGDRWLNVKISVHTAKDASGPTGPVLFSVDSLTSVVTGVPGHPEWSGKQLADLMRTGQIKPGQLEAVREIITDGASASDTDVARYFGARADFTLTRNANGTVTVVDNVVAPILGADGLRLPLMDDEGTDTLSNIEYARFTNYDATGIPNGTFTDVYLGAASGAPIITGTGTQLTASTDGIIELNGVNAGTVRYQWQQSANGTSNWTNVGGLTANPNLTPNNTNFYRVIVSYTDNAGFNERLTSLITARVGTNGVDTLVGTTDPNLLIGRNGNDNLDGGDGNDTLVGGTGGDTLTGGDGNDTASYADQTGNINVSLTVTGAQAGAGGDILTSIENLVGGSGNDTLTGSTGDNVLQGGAGNDTLSGGDGNDLLDGGTNANNTGDVMTGGTGDDTYVVDDTSGNATQRDSIVEAAGAAGGIDTVRGSLSLDLANYANVENMTLTGGGNFSATGNGLNNVLTGNSGNNTLAGLGGTDTAVFTGTAKGHTISTNNAGVLTISSAADGTDTLTSIEQVSFGSALYRVMQGTAAGTTLTGTAAGDLIFGLGGNDTVNAGAGDDIIVWRAGDGRDLVAGGTNSAVGDVFSIVGDGTAETYTVYARADWLLIAGNLAASLSANTDIVITRNGTNAASIIAELDQIEEIVINTGGGADTVLVVGNFNPTDLAFNTITVDDGGGSTKVDLTKLSSTHHVAFHVTGGNDEMIGGREQDQVLDNGNGYAHWVVYGSDDDDFLTGADGQRILSGGKGNDAYEVDDNDTVDEAEDGGIDTLRSSVSNLDLRNYANVENCVLTGSSALSITGNDGVNSLVGNSGSNRISGAGGNDTAIGAAGNDTIDGGAGNDIVNGEDGADVLSGSAGNDTINGGADNDIVNGDNGSDVLSGSGGNDTINGGEGNDLINGGDGNDALLGGAGNDVLNGAAGNDVINGGAGNNRIIGGAGNDRIDVSPGNDVIVLQPGFGNDSVVGFDANAANGQDKIDIRDFNITAATFDARVDILDFGNHTMVVIDGRADQKVTLLAVSDHTSVTVNDFILF